MNMTRLLLNCILLIIIPVSLNAQKQEVDAVHLNNGEVYRGSLKEHINPEIVQLETLCLNTRLFNVSDINRIDREQVDLSAFSRQAVSDAGYFNRTNLGALIGTGNENNAIFSIQMVNGYKFGRRYHPGIGVGLEFYDQSYVPVFADFTYLLTTGRVSPFVRGSFGYSLPLEDPPGVWGRHLDNRGGFLYSGGFGASIRTGASSALDVSLVYRFQSLKSVQTEDWTEQILNLEQQFNRISLRIGFLFD